jgi:methionyl-tRNA synthetase
VNRYYVTTSIPYVNACPHIGFALELAQADALARYHRLMGREVRFQTGADENALKNVLAAREQGLTTQELVDRNTGLFRELSVALNVSHDTFIRTTEERHARGVHQFWRSLKPEDIYLTEYAGQYCIGCEDFLQDRDLVDGLCPDHGAAPVEVHERNYFFRLSAYQTRIEQLIESDSIRVTPETRKNEVLSFVRQGLQDISVSRDAARADNWGISVPDDPSQVIYVWIDALINYLTGPGFGSSGDWTRWWNDQTTKIHVIGKNVWKFHAIYWPALLLSAGLPLPNEILVHGFLTERGRKISKSLGNVIDPLECVDRFGADGVRYFLLAEVSPFLDSDVSIDRIRQVYNTNLANNLGNLVSRLATLCARADYGRYEEVQPPDAPQGYHEAISVYQFDRALGSVWALVDDLNQQIQHIEPWRLLKADEPRLRDYLSRWLRQLNRIGYWLSPFLPQTSAGILGLLSGPSVAPSKALFPRIIESPTGHGLSNLKS